MNNKVVAGVCAGIGNYFGWSHSNARLFYILLSVLSAAFPGILVYILFVVINAKSVKRKNGYDKT